MALAIIAWAPLAIFVGGSWIGIPLLGRAYRRALATLVVATTGGFVFSFLAGFSIGRFSALLPLLVTAFAVTYGRAARLQVAAYVAALLIYLLFAWNRSIIGESSSTYRSACSPTLAHCAFRRHRRPA